VGRGEKGNQGTGLGCPENLQGEEKEKEKEARTEKPVKKSPSVASKRERGNH
jgi:hypothetical protein